MFEKVNPGHPDKVADRIAGAIVDLAYERQQDPRVAVEVLIGHGYCYVIAESSVAFIHDDIQPIVNRIAGAGLVLRLISVKQDEHLAKNQDGRMRCGDNGIFKGAPVTEEQKRLTHMCRYLYSIVPRDGKMVHASKYTVCQSGMKTENIRKVLLAADDGQMVTPERLLVNPLGDWDGGLGVDTGATNRKLGSDMGDGVTGGGLHGKDLSKADVSVNIYCHIKAQLIGKPFLLSCSIGDEEVCGITYADIVETARAYIKSIGGFERLAEWGLIR